MLKTFLATLVIMLLSISVAGSQTNATTINTSAEDVRQSS